MSVQNPPVRLKHLERAQDGPVARVTLNRPDRYNALSLELMTELRETLETIGTDPATQVVVLAGAGRGFSAGHDLGEMIGREDAFYDGLFDACTRLMQTIHRMPQPVIARVHGVATAAGCQLVAACDLAVAARDARFGTPGVRIGLFCSTPMVPLSRAIGRKRALQMLLTGDIVDASTAVDWGLVNEVVARRGPGRRRRPRSPARITRRAPRTVAIGKRRSTPRWSGRGRRVRAHQARDGPNTSVADAQEGVGAFLEKRPPVWREG